MRPLATWRDDLVTGLLALSLTLGLFFAGWNALTRAGGAPGVFLNAWHGLLFTGFTGMAFWSLTRHQDIKRSALTRIPKGYGLAVLGLAVGFVALSGEATWQTAFGGPAESTMSINPFNVILLVASFPLAATALRSMWLKQEGPWMPTLKAFAPVLLSAIAVTSLALFAAQFQSPLVAWTRPDPAAAGAERLLQINPPAAIVLTNLILIAPVLLILRRWRPPLGGVTVLLTSVAVMASALTGFDRVGGFFGALAGGLAADLVIHNSSSASPASVRRRVALIATPAFWTTWYVGIVGFEGIAWPVVSWAVAVAVATLSAFLLALLVNSRTTSWESNAARAGRRPGPNATATGRRLSRQPSTERRSGAGAPTEGRARRAADEVLAPRRGPFAGPRRP